LVAGFSPQSSGLNPKQVHLRGVVEKMVLGFVFLLVIRLSSPVVPLLVLMGCGDGDGDGFDKIF